MLKVECDSCKASYPIDERRVPPTGLKMRCPKCGHSFLVTHPGTAPAAPAPAVAPPQPPPAPPGQAATGAGPRPPAAGNPLKRTMVGVAPAPPPVVQKPPPPAPVPAPAAQAAPPVPPPRAAMTSDFPAALAFEEASLPVVAADLPAAKPAPPQAARPFAPAPVRAPAPAPAPVRAPAPAPAPARAAPPAPTPAPATFADALELDLPVVAGSGVDLPAVGRSKAGAGNAEADLPVVSRADLPAAKRAAPKPAPAPAAPSPRAAPAPPAAPAAVPDDFDLPIVAPRAPAAKKAAVAAPKVGIEIDLPIVAADLPSAAASLPVVAASLPVPAASLPVPAAGLPVHQPSLPVPAPVSRAFGEVELPGISDSLPTAPRVDPSLAGQDDAFLAFGEIDLPRDNVAPSIPPPAQQSIPPFASLPPAPAKPIDSADFGDIQLGDAPPPRTRSSPRPPPPGPPTSARNDGAGRESGGMGFGEVDLGASEAPPAGDEIGLDGIPQSAQATEAPLLPAVQAAATAPIARAATADEEPAKRSAAKWVVLGVLGAVALGGASLHLTPFGAYGYLFIGDKVHAADYERAAASEVGVADVALAPDTYDAAKAGVDGAYAAHARTPRARSLSAYVAFLDFAEGARFGPDPARAPRAKQLLADLIPPNQPVKYVDLALAAQLADAGDVDKARKALDAAAPRYASDPAAVDVALLQGNLALYAGDATAATTAFGHAADLSAKGPAGASDARAHFGLARAYDRLGNAQGVKKEIDLALAASANHAGALTLRARRATGTVDAADASRDLAAVLEGPAKAHASPLELSAAYAAKAWLSLRQGGASDARDSFEQAIKLDARNVDALNGEGRLLMNDGRYTEALARFDTALQFDANSPDIIANDAEAKVGLERLADAKTQLVAARERFPRSLPVMLLLAKAEQHLGNNDAAEAVLRSALALADPTRDDALLPYVAMSELLSARGRLGEARDILDEARKKLPPSGRIERAFGEVSELQGDYDGAIAHYKAALARDPRDVVAHFKLGVALRRVRRFDDASAELDQVAAVDKEYPGLSLERGLLYEESGDVQKAIELFKGALAKAPDDPDLQLRVGSAYVAINLPDDALSMLQKVLKQRPTSAEAHHYIGRAMMLKGDSMMADALRYLKRAVELDPNRAEYHVYLAWAANDAMPANLELAHEEVEKALALDKVSAEAYWQRAVLERIEGAIDDAVKDAKHALELRPSRYEAHATLAECYDQKNDPTNSMAEWAKAIAGDGAVAKEDEVAHPFWRFQYGKLLGEKGGGPQAALVHLVPAVKTAEKSTPRPGWLAPLEFLTAEMLRKVGRKADAVEHYRRFLEIAPLNSPDRLDAQNALNALAPQR